MFGKFRSLIRRPGNRALRFSPGATEATALRSVHQHEFGILKRPDAETFLAADRGAVTGIDPHAVDLDLSGRRDEVKMARLLRRITRAFASLQRGGKYPRVR